MATVTMKRQAKAPGQVQHKGDTYIYCGRGRAPCSAHYCSGNKHIELYYANFASFTGTFAIFQTHNNRLEQFAVQWSAVEDKRAYSSTIFLVGPIDHRDDRGYLHAAGAWVCQG